MNDETKCYLCEQKKSGDCDICSNLICEDHGILSGEKIICQNCYKMSPDRALKLVVITAVILIIITTIIIILLNQLGVF